MQRKELIQRQLHYFDLTESKNKQAGVSNSQLYKQAGNAVTVDVVEQIGKRLVLEDEWNRRF